MRKIFIMAFAILVGSVYLKAQINHTVAGKPGSIYSTPGYNGDNILATSAELNGPGGVAVDGDGNVYIADASNYRVRKVDKNGIITTVVGTGVSGNIIQHYHPTLSQLGLPSDVAINAAGTHLYILDVSNNYVLMVDFSASPNSISIIAGGGISTNDGILATEANISNLGVFNIALDKSENLYISEGGAPSSTSSGMIRKVTYSNQIINTVANAATSGLNHPLGLAIDANYNIYVADYGTYEVKKITPSGSASVIAGNGTLGYSGDGGPATSAAFENPSDVKIDSYGNIYIVDYGANVVRKIDNSGIINTFITGGSSGYNTAVEGALASNTYIYNPFYAAIDNCGNVYVSSLGGNLVKEILENRLGNISHPTLGNIPKVTVNITGGLTQSIISNGDYYRNLPNGVINNNSTITPYKNNDINRANGVTVGDIALIQQHILSIKKLGDAYKCFAADVNGDGKISALDLVYIERLILQLDQTFTNAFDGTQRLWTFVDKYKIFGDPNKPFNSCINCSTPTNFREAFSRTLNANCTTTGVDFFGMKLGDVNYSWDKAVAKQAPVTIYYDNLDVTNTSIGDNIIVPIKVKNFKDIIASQYTLNFNSNNLQYVGVENTDGQLNFNDQQSGIGKVSFAWYDNSVAGTTLSDGSVLFNLVFKKLQKVSNQDIQLSSDITSVEVSNSNFDLVALVKNNGKIIDTSSDAIVDTTETWSIVPSSSVKGNLFIDANSNSVKNINIIVTDANGNQVYATSRILYVGSNTIYSNLRSAVNLPQGIYYVTIYGLNSTVTQTLFVNVPDNVPSADTIAQGSIQGCNSALSTYALQAQLYSDIKTNTGLQADSILQAFEAQNASSNFNLIYEIDSALSTGDFITANSLLSGFIPSNGIDSNYINYYHWILKVTVDSLSDDDINGINALALNCPVTAGTVVYSARDFYNSIIGDNQTFNNACENNGIALPAIGSTVSALCMGNSTTFTDSYSGGIWSTSSPSIASIDSNGNITPLSAGRAIITYTTTSNCITTSVTQPIVINALPNATIIGTNALCANSSITLIGSTNGGNWSSSATGIATINSTSGIVNGVSAGVANITYSVTDLNGCSATSSDSIVVNPLPNVTINGVSVLCISSPATFTDSTSGGVWNSSNPVIATIDTLTGIVNGVSVGKDTISYIATSINGCVNTNYKTITIDTIPVVTMSATPNPSCAGQTITFNASANDATYTWTGSGATPVPTTGATVLCVNPTGGTKSFTVTATNVCGVGTKTLSVPVNTLPSTPSISPSGSGGVITVAPCGTQQLKSSASTGNQWYQDGMAISGATGQYYVAGAGHSYSVTTTNSNGCTSDMSGTKTVTASVFSFTPNPAHSSISVTGTNVAEIDIINNIGNILISQPVSAGSGSSKTTINVSYLGVGSYTISVRYNTGCVQSQTLIIN